MAGNSPAARLFEERNDGVLAWLGFPQLKSRQEVVAAMAVFAFAMMVFFGPIMTLTDSNVGAGDQGNGFRQVGYLAIFAAALWVTDPRQRGWHVLMLPVPILLALAWCWISIGWAIEPGISFRRILLTTMVIWTSFILVKGAGYRLTVATLRLALIVALALNYVMVFADPAVGIMTSSDDVTKQSAAYDMWCGFMAHKNFAGAVCAVTVIMFLFDAEKIKPALRWGVVVLAALFLYKSHSKTSAGLIVPAAAAAWVFMTAGDRLRVYAVPAIAIGTSVLWMIESFYQDTIAVQFLGPTAFTGRGAIWTALMRFSADHPLLGAGFGSFWDIGDDSPIYTYGSGFTTKVAVGHNGYIDLMVSIGIPGMLLVAFAMIIWPLVRMLTWQGVRPQAGGLMCALLAFCVGHNVTESSMFARDAIVGMFMLFAIAFINEYATRSVGRRKTEGAAGDELMRSMRRRTGESSGKSGGRSGSGGRSSGKRRRRTA